MHQKKSTSWEPVNQWYKKSVGEEGNYYHQKIVLPGALQLLSLKAGDSLLDLACGQGVLARQISTQIRYCGVDASRSLIADAKKLNKNQNQQFIYGDVTKQLPLKESFSHASVILAIQNIESPLYLLKNAAKYLDAKGKLVIVMNHPCFRIPRQSSWGIDDNKKVQYRRIDRYYSPLKIPIQAHPSKQDQSPETWSFHYPLSSYFKWLHEAGFAIETLEEWCSDKTSTGKAAKMENLARNEIPLFLAIKAIKI